MPKLKAGEWFLFEGQYAVLLTSKPDQDGELKIAYRFPSGRFHSGWMMPEDLAECPRLKVARWCVVPSAKRADYHNFFAVFSPKGRKAIVSAGCMMFSTLTAARAHWLTRERIWLTENGRGAENEALNAWSLRYVDKVARAMKAVR